MLRVFIELGWAPRRDSWLDGGERFQLPIEIVVGWVLIVVEDWPQLRGFLNHWCRFDQLLLYLIQLLHFLVESDLGIALFLFPLVQLFDILHRILRVDSHELNGVLRVLPLALDHGATQLILRTDLKRAAFRATELGRAIDAAHRVLLFFILPFFLKFFLFCLL